ncbi:MAG: PLP-dependent lyase/thiolase [Candidatus Paceibacterota bacterium]|jgi:threonine dehydratase
MTPTEHCPDLAKVLGLSDLYLKREDLHKYGSHKGRSIPTMIDHYYKNGDRRFVISSSGNAALAAALYVIELNNKNSETIDLNIFVGKNITEYKLEKLRKVADDSNGHVQVLIKERTLQALSQAVEEGWRSLRQSTDDVALVGYKSLAEELSKIKKAGAVFIGTSSGTTAEALAEYFIKNKLPIQVHIVQTSSCHPLSDEFENYDGDNEKSIADAIVSLTSQRKSKLTPLIKETGGYGWTASNTEIRTAKELVQKHANLDISNNSALSVVGAMQSVYRDWKIKGAVICLVCGD